MFWRGGRVQLTRRALSHFQFLTFFDFFSRIRTDSDSVQIPKPYIFEISTESESVRNRNLYGFGKHQKWLRLRYDCDFFRDLRSAYNSYKIAICAQFAIFDCRILWFARNLLRRYNLWVSHNLRFLTIFDYLQVCEIRKYDWLKKKVKIALFGWR